MKQLLKPILSSVLFISLVVSMSVNAQIEVFDNEEGSRTQGAPAPETGKKAASEYFIQRKRAASKRSRSRRETRSESRSADRGVASSGDRYLSLSLGVFFDDQSYKWGESNQDNVAELTGGVTYRIGEWVKSMDLNFRADLTSYDLNEGDALKISLMPIITFPDVRSDFPLYFGGGGGIGVFFKQIDEESHLSFDYTVLAGVRLMNLVENMGFMAEVGVKNHILLLSDGQFNGSYFSLGTVFDF